MLFQVAALDNSPEFLLAVRKNSGLSKGLDIYVHLNQEKQPLKNADSTDNLMEVE